MNVAGIKLKVCGMRDKLNIGEVASLHPDYMGFIFYANSPRFVGENFFVPTLQESVKPVGVFVNELTEKISVLAQAYQLEYVQLHGDESVKQCEELKNQKLKIIKVFSVDDQMNFDRTKIYKECADFFLFDTKGKYYGGNAQVFNWKILERYDQDVPFFLSGGLSLDSIAGVKDLRGMNIHAIDINSGVEIAPGVKDIDKIRKLKSILDANS
jgi:phosphoribosylanthranilate isomerase